MQDIEAMEGIYCDFVVRPTVRQAGSNPRLDHHPSPPPPHPPTPQFSSRRTAGVPRGGPPERKRVRSLAPEPEDKEHTEDQRRKRRRQDLHSPTTPPLAQQWRDTNMHGTLMDTPQRKPSLNYPRGQIAPSAPCHRHGKCTPKYVSTSRQTQRISSDEVVTPTASGSRTAAEEVTLEGRITRSMTALAIADEPPAYIDLTQANDDEIEVRNPFSPITLPSAPRMPSRRRRPRPAAPSTPQSAPAPAFGHGPSFPHQSRTTLPQTPTTSGARRARNERAQSVIVISDSEPEQDAEVELLYCWTPKKTSRKGPRRG